MRHGSSAPPRRTRVFARQEEGQGIKKKENCCCCCVDLFVVDRVLVLLWPALVGLCCVVLIGYC